MITIFVGIPEHSVKNQNQRTIAVALGLVRENFDRRSPGADFNLDRVGAGGTRGLAAERQPENEGVRHGMSNQGIRRHLTDVSGTIIVPRNAVGFQSDGEEPESTSRLETCSTTRLCNFYNAGDPVASPVLSRFDSF